MPSGPATLRSSAPATLPASRPATLPEPRPATPTAPDERTDTQHVDGSIEVDLVRSGDLVFCARTSFLQGLCTRAGEPWRHVGLALERDGEPWVIEVSGPRFGQRRLADVVEAYELSAIGRVAPAERTKVALAAEWCGEHVGQEQVYAWDDLMLAGFIAVTRRWCLPGDQYRLERAVTAATEALFIAQQRRDVPDDVHPGYSCSAFILAAFAEVDYPFEFDLGLPRAAGQRPSLWELIKTGPRPLRSVEGTRMTNQQGLDALRALVTGMITLSGPASRGDTLDDGEQYRWATPGDLWRSSTIAERRYLSG